MLPTIRQTGSQRKARVWLLLAPMPASARAGSGGRCTALLLGSLESSTSALCSCQTSAVLAPPRPGGTSKEPLMTSKMPVDDKVLAANTQTTTPPAWQRALIAVADADQVGPVVELARRAGVGEARVLHLNLRESYGGRRFPLETDAAATEWGADLIILGPSRRGQLATRLLGSATLHVLQHAPCPVLVASPAGKGHTRHAAEKAEEPAGELR